VAAAEEVKAGAKLRLEQHYKLGQVIGTGHYARVQLATCLKDGKKYAVKSSRKMRAEMRCCCSYKGSMSLAIDAYCCIDVVVAPNVACSTSADSTCSHVSENGYVIPLLLL